MKVAVPSESNHGERRVALVPGVVPALSKAGVSVAVEVGAGAHAGFPDSAYEEQGATVISDRAKLFSEADLILQVHGLEDGTADHVVGKLMHQGQVLLGLLNPFGAPRTVYSLTQQRITSFALELLPRISRAQSMDALTSMATIAGYKAVLLAAGALGKMFPLMMTAAGTITPARVFVVGAGVAGLQAIATSRRLGAVVQAYDVRPAVKEQVESLGAKFVELPLETKGAEGSGGYAKAMDEEFYRRQREMMKQVVAESDVIITTAAIPGKKAPVLITRELVEAVHAGSVIVDLAAETGGNCELTKAGQNIEFKGVTIMGPLNIASTIPYHASMMYARNIVAFLQNLVKEGKIQVDMEDQIIRDTLVTHMGEVISPVIRGTLGLDEAKK